MATEVSKTKATDPEAASKLEAGWRYVTIPEKDLYDYKFGSVWNNLTEYKAGTHLVPAAVADDIEDRLRVRAEGDVRLMRPQAHRKSLQETGNVS